MSKKIAIIGSGADKEWLSAQLASKGLNDVLIVTPDEAKEIVKAEDRFTKYPDLSVIEITNPYSDLQKEEPFVCKGKHQYKRVESETGYGIIEVEWICQCGRKTTD